MNETKEKALRKAAQLTVKSELLQYLSDFCRYDDYATRDTYCDSCYSYKPDEYTPDEFLDCHSYEYERYYIGHEKYYYQFELIEKIVKAIGAL